MNKIQGYDEAQSYTGESRTLPAGKYICEIKGAKEVETKNGKKQLVLQLDIAEGEYKDHYSNLYAANAERNGTNAKWNNEAADALDPLAGGQVYRHGYGFVAVPVLDGRPR